MNLTPRQVEILRLTADGYTCPAIARRLFIEVNTVKSHRLYVYRRLRARNAAHAVAIAYRRGILGDHTRQLDSARAWAVELEQQVERLSRHAQPVRDLHELPGSDRCVTCPSRNCPSCPEVA